MKMATLTLILLFWAGPAWSAEVEQGATSERSATLQADEGQNATVRVNNPEAAFAIGEKDRGPAPHNIQWCAELCNAGNGVCYATCRRFSGIRACTGNGIVCCFLECT